MDDAALDRLLDTVRDDQLEVAARLAQGVQEHEAWRQLVHVLKMEAAKAGTNAAAEAIPLLMAALKLALA